ncbi:hypothetical protein TRFO_41610 [Tritrichomonas foetus]|uniref:Uncharacterized protein n=1 Tax=Tritrichomonas foetus TaxID=1144522 RepID=A0A1J4L499_9EUKA|nr:hypothetical protein TRFO_41610 [Tritrichomonas foetus]|eukprot:OHT16757.1 hypothetical protein TRFO_41610 [Tritrichomonas foetus]
MSFEIDDSSDDFLGTSFKPRQYSMSTDPDDAEIEHLQNQIDEMNNFLISVKSHAEDRQLRYEKTIEKLQQSIQEVQEKCEFDLENQIARQNAEVAQALADQEAEIEELILGTHYMNKDTNNWRNISEDLNYLSDKIEEFDIKKSIAGIKDQGQEIEFLRSTQIEDAKTKRQAILKSQERQIKALQDEIERYQSASRQDDQHFQMVTADCSFAQEKRERTHKIIVEKMNYEANQRAEIFGTHLRVLQRQVDRERSKTDTDTKALRDTEESLVQMKRKTSQHCLQQFNEATNDINRIQKLLEKHAESEESHSQMTLNSRSKTTNLQRQNVMLKRKIEQMADEIAAMEASIQRGCAELKRGQTPKKTSTASGSLKSSHGLFY